jgi:DNA (cytosine-5)-methyltransferase 1
MFPEYPESMLSLGDVSLLKMDVGMASRYWGIESPIGRRDRKSGARKRSQEETEAARLMVQGAQSAQDRIEF